MRHGRQIKAPQQCAQDAPLMMRAMVVRRRYMAATMAIELAQERVGTPKIDVAPKQRHERCATGPEPIHHDGPGHLHKNRYQRWWARSAGRPPW